MSPQPRVDNLALRSRATQTNSWSWITASKAPEVTLAFWVVKIAATATGASAAGFLSRDLGLGLAATTAITAVLLAAVLVADFLLTRHVPAVFWLGVLLSSVVGGLLCENLVAGLGLRPGEASAILLVGLVLVAAAWYRSEHTLSIHTIVTRRREAFYWLAVLLSFALGSSAGDLVVRHLPLGSLRAVLLFGGLITVVAVGHYLLGLDPLLAFWVTFVLTGPFGTSLSGLLAASHESSGPGLGSNATGIASLAVVIAFVAWFTVVGSARRTARRTSWATARQ